MNKLHQMLDELFPDKDDEYKNNMLWNCCCYPFMGTDDEAIALYREQIEKCVKGNPENPSKFASDEMSRIWEETRPKRDLLELKDQLRSAKNRVTMLEDLIKEKQKEVDALPEVHK